MGIKDCCRVLCFNCMFLYKCCCCDRGNQCEECPEQLQFTTNQNRVRFKGHNECKLVLEDSPEDYRLRQQKNDTCNDMSAKEHYRLRHIQESDDYKPSSTQSSKHKMDTKSRCPVENDNIPCSSQSRRMDRGSSQSPSYRMDKEVKYPVEKDMACCSDLSAEENYRLGYQQESDDCNSTQSSSHRMDTERRYPTDNAYVDLVRSNQSTMHPRSRSSGNEHMDSTCCRCIKETLGNEHMDSPRCRCMKETVPNTSNRDSNQQISEKPRHSRRSVVGGDNMAPRSQSMASKEYMQPGNDSVREPRESFTNRSKDGMRRSKTTEILLECQYFETAANEENISRKKLAHGSQSLSKGEDMQPWSDSVKTSPRASIEKATNEENNSRKKLSKDNDMQPWSDSVKTSPRGTIEKATNEENKSRKKLSQDNDMQPWSDSVKTPRGSIEKATNEENKSRKKLSKDDDIQPFPDSVKTSPRASLEKAINEENTRRKSVSVEPSIHSRRPSISGTLSGKCMTRRSQSMPNNDDIQPWNDSIRQPKEEYVPKAFMMRISQPCDKKRSKDGQNLETETKEENMGILYRSQSFSKDSVPKAFMMRIIPLSETNYPTDHLCRTKPAEESLECHNLITAASEEDTEPWPDSVKTSPRGSREKSAKENTRRKASSRDEDIQAWQDSNRPMSKRSIANAEDSLTILEKKKKSVDQTRKDSYTETVPRNSSSKRPQSFPEDQDTSGQKSPPKVCINLDGNCVYEAESLSAIYPNEEYNNNDFQHAAASQKPNCTETDFWGLDATEKEDRQKANVTRTQSTMRELKERFMSEDYFMECTVCGTSNCEQHPQRSEQHQQRSEQQPQRSEQHPERNACTDRESLPPQCCPPRPEIACNPDCWNPQQEAANKVMSFGYSKTSSSDNEQPLCTTIYLPVDKPWSNVCPDVRDAAVSTDPVRACLQPPVNVAEQSKCVPAGKPYARKPFHNKTTKSPANSDDDANCRSEFQTEYMSQFKD